MPVLTDRKEPDDFDKGGNSDEPNDYAIKYLFGLRKPQQEIWRTGHVLFYSGAAANLMASGMLLVALEFNLPWQILLFGLAILATTVLAVYRVWKAPPTNLLYGLAALPLLVMLLGVLDGLTLHAEVKDLWWLVLYYLPGSLVMLIGVRLFLARRITDKDAH